MQVNTHRITKNTVALFFREMLLMLIGLYTLRVIIRVLGVEDYGVYNVISGVVTMFSFLSSSMAAASQRYFSFELGRGDYEHLKEIFSLSLLIFILISSLILIISETVVLWIVCYKLSISLERKNIAFWVYQFTVISFIFAILTTPYMAMIIAREDMKIYAYASIIEAILKLIMIFLLQVISLDKLQLYGLLMCSVTIINSLIYIVICSLKYQECKFKFYWDNKLYKEIFYFTGWSLLGNLTTIAKNQAITILLNQIFNPIVVAAKGIATLISGAVSSLSINFSYALQPQIIKSFSSGEKDKMFGLVSLGTKAVFFLLFMCALPFVLEIPIILSLWLVDPPEYAVIFTRLAIVDVFINSISLPLTSAMRATGNIKLNETALSIAHICCFLISWLVLITGAPAHSVMFVAIGISIVMFFIRLFFACKILFYSMWQFFYKSIFPVFIASMISVALPLFLYTYLRQSIFRLCIVTVTSIFSVFLWMYLIGLNKPERKQLKEIVIQILKR
jgi:O-antigen/teichoic acid export membrane protein